jgi:hypothetical protein
MIGPRLLVDWYLTMDGSVYFGGYIITLKKGLWKLGNWNLGVMEIGFRVT